MAGAAAKPSKYKLVLRCYAVSNDRITGLSILGFIGQHCTAVHMGTSTVCWTEDLRTPEATGKDSARPRATGGSTPSPPRWHPHGSAHFSSRGHRFILGMEASLESSDEPGGGCVLRPQRPMDPGTRRAPPGSWESPDPGQTLGGGEPWPLMTVCGGTPQGQGQGAVRWSGKLQGLRPDCKPHAGTSHPRT